MRRSIMPDTTGKKMSFFSAPERCQPPSVPVDVPLPHGVEHIDEMQDVNCS